MATRWSNLLRVASVPLLLMWTAFVWTQYLPRGLAGAGERLAPLFRIPSPLIWKPWWLELFLAMGLAVAALSVGNWLLSRLPVEFTVGERLMLGPACGFLVLIVTAASLGLVGGFRPMPLRILVGLFVMAAVAGLPHAARLLAESVATLAKRLRAEPEAILYLTVAAVFLFFGLVAAALPETSHDALAVHLYYPRLFLERGTFYAADLYRSMSPFYTQVLYALGLTLSGPGLARFLNFLFLPASGLAVLVLAARIAPPSLRLTAGSLALLFLVSAPSVLYHATACYPDLAQAFWSLLALYAMLRFLDSEARAWLGLAGLFAGMAAGTKYAGLYVVLVLAVMCAVASLRTGWRPALSRLVLFGAIVTAVAGPWYARNWYFTGDPLHPSLYRLMPNPAIHPVEAEDLMRDAKNARRLPATAGNMLLLPWLLTVEGDRFQGAIGPVFLWALPVVLLSTRRERGWLALLFAAAALSLVFVIGPQWIRYFFSAATALCSLSAAALVAQGLGWLRPLALLLVLVNLPGLNEFWVGGGRNVLAEVRYDVAAGPTTFEQYQRQRIPGFDTVARWNQLPLPAGARILPVPIFESFPAALSRWEVLDIFENSRIVCQGKDGVLVPCYSTFWTVVLPKMDEHRITLLAIRHNLLYMDRGSALRLEDPMLRKAFRFLDYSSGTFLFRRHSGELQSGASYVNADLLYRWKIGAGVSENPSGSIQGQRYQPMQEDSRVALKFGSPAAISWEVDLGIDPRLNLMISATSSDPVSLQVGAGALRKEYTCRTLQPVVWTPCSIDLKAFSGTAALITLTATAAAIADPVVLAAETTEPVPEVVEPFLFVPSSVARPMQVRFTPDKVRSGKDSYVIEIPELANATIDLLVNFQGGLLRESLRFRTLDARGRATVTVPSGMSPGVFEVKGVRRAGDRRWLAAVGKVEVIP